MIFHEEKNVLDLEPGVLAFRKHSSLLLGRIHLLLFGADQNGAG